MPIDYFIRRDSRLMPLYPHIDFKHQGPQPPDSQTMETTASFFIKSKLIHRLKAVQRQDDNDNIV